jgi:enoyl-CoA hydratase
MSYQNLRLSTRDGMAIVTVDRPAKLNALDARTLSELEAAFREIDGDAAIRGVILTGAGEKAFVAGADIGELAQLTAVEAQAFAARGQRVLASIESLGKPVVAAVNGFALGGGCELALACHVRVAADSARLGTPEVKLGIMCGYAGTQRLPRLLGKGRALELLLTGEMIDAQEALRLGLVNQVVPLARLLDEAEALLLRMIKNAPISLRLTLQAVNTGLELPLEEAQRLEAALFALTCSTEDKAEGTRAFLEKRPAEFEGR